MSGQRSSDAEKTQSEFRKKCCVEGGFAYSASALLVVLLSFFLSFFARGDAAKQDWFLYLSYLFSQIALLGGAAIYFYRSKEPLRSVYTGCKPRYFLIAILLEFGLLFSLGELNGYFIRLLELAGYQSGATSVPSLEGWNLLPALLVIALLPAVFEELMFRGILSRKMHGDGWGLVPTVLIAGAMFSLFHGSPEQTLYQFLCGACFTLVAVRAGSVFPTMLAHFLNNAIILIVTACGVETFSALPFGGYLTLMIGSAVCLVGALSYLIFFDKQGNQKGGVKDGGAFFLAAACGLAVCAVEWAVVLVRGFLS